MKNPCYDYEKQAWIDSLPERKRQLTEELELLLSPRGEEYARFTGSQLSHAIADCRYSLSSMSDVTTVNA